MTETRAVPLAWLSGAVGAGYAVTGQPLCPACIRGYLHPYRVQIGLRNAGMPYSGVSYLDGWVAVCVGNADANRAKEQMYAAAAAQAAENGGDDSDYRLEPGDLVDVAPCGFSMPMSAVP